MREFILSLGSNAFFGFAISILGFYIGLVLKKRFSKTPPLIVAIIFVIAVLLLFNIPYKSYMEGGKYISYLLTPTTICLALPLYEELSKLKKNLKAIALGIFVGIAMSFISVYAICRLFNVDRQIFLSLIPKSITTAIGIGLSEELGGIVTLTVSSIVLTGNIGALMADGIYKLFKIDEPIARGIGLGASAHAIGTSKAGEYGELASASAGLSLSVCAILSVLALQLLAKLY